MKPLQKRRVQAQRKFAQGSYIFINNNNISSKTEVSPAAVKDGPSKEDRNVIHNRLSAKNLLDVVSFQNIHSHVPVVLVQRLSPNFETACQNGRDTGCRASAMGGSVNRKSGRKTSVGIDASLSREGLKPIRNTASDAVSISTSRAVPIIKDETHSLASRSNFVIEKQPLGADAKSLITDDPNVAKGERPIADCELGRTKRFPVVELFELDWTDALMCSDTDTSEKEHPSEQSGAAQSAATPSEVVKFGTLGEMSVSRGEMRRLQSRRSVGEASVPSQPVNVKSVTSDRLRSLKSKTRCSVQRSENGSNGSASRLSLLDRYKKVRALKKHNDIKSRSKTAQSSSFTKVENGLRLRSRLLVVKKTYPLKKGLNTKLAEKLKKQKPKRKQVTNNFGKEVKKNITKKKSEKKITKRRSSSKTNENLVYSSEDERPLKYLKVNNQNRAALRASEPGTSPRITRSAAEKALTGKPARTPPTQVSTQDFDFKHPQLPIRFAKSNQNSESRFASVVSGSSTTSDNAVSKNQESLESPVPTPGPLPSPSPGSMPDPLPVPYVVSSSNFDTIILPTPPALLSNTSCASLLEKERQALTKPTEDAKSKPNPAEAPMERFYDKFEIVQWLKTNETRQVAAPTPNTGVEEATASRAPSPCPSESLQTLRDIVRAPVGMLEKRCKCCEGCHRVNTVTQIATLMQKPSQTTSTNDVYEFNTESDGVAQPVVSYRQHGNSRAQDKEEEDNDLYLDLLPQNSPHIIQMTCIKGKRNVMRARLVARSEIHSTQDLKLVEHENLLEQLLLTLLNNDRTVINQDKTTPSKKEPEINMADKTNTKQKPKIGEGAKLVEAPVYKLEESDFNDPIKFFEKIMPIAAKYGLCKVVAPESFKPKCILADMLKFKVTNHYIARLYSRWGSAAREMSAMKAYLATQNVTFNRVPLLESLEVNLPKLYAVVQRNGGLKQVIEKKRWGRVAEEMRFNKGPNTEKMLDSYYVKYLLPYDTASNQERQKIIGTVEKSWNKKHRKLLEWATNPLHHQKKLLGDTDSSEDDASDGDSDDGAAHALAEAEDCIVAGRPMNLNGFKKVAKLASDMYLPKASATPLSISDIENEYWRLVLFGTEHVCVNAASIDTESGGYGFSKNRQDPSGRHPWNLKMLSSNSGNVLRSLSKVIGVTVPTLHLGMVFSTSCWHRDPHGLPWVEYMHEGPSKIWYGIPDEQSSNFRRAVEALCPTSCQNKSIWLSSDITMIPPNLLREHNVSLSRAVQNPGEYIIVFPKAYSCSISTGFTISESVYFATHSWLKQVHQVFRELRDSCEPTTFSLEQLLIALAEDTRSSLAVLQTVQASLTTVINEELHNRLLLTKRNIASRMEPHKQAKRGRSWNARDQDECQICRSSLFLSKVVGVIGKKTPVCLMHALRLLDAPKCKGTDVANIELVIFYTQKRLEDIVSNIQKRLIVL